MKILITAGPTREPIDPVRFISNYSTGAMGYAIAKTAKARGHKVGLISGPTYLLPPLGVEAVSVITAEEMFKAVKRYMAKSDCIVMSAAVSDFRPKHYFENKQKRKADMKSIELVENRDILSWVGKRKEGKILIGFCMETENLLTNAKKKMRNKKLDLIVANKIGRKNKAFGPGKTSVVILGPAKEKDRLACMTKERIAGILLDKIEQLWYKKRVYSFRQRRTSLRLV